MKVVNLYKTLEEHFGRRNWWPTISENQKFEIIVGVLLTQQTTWKNVEKAIVNLQKKGLLDPIKLAGVNKRSLWSLVRCCGYYKQKSDRLIEFSKYLVNNYDGDVDRFLNSVSREELLSLKGFGKESADSVLLYAAGRLFFPIDAYTFRMAERIGIGNKDYDDLQEYFHKELAKDVESYKELHALIVELGKNYCKKKPVCEECPLKNEICLMESVKS